MNHDHLIHFLIRQAQGVLRDSRARPRQIPPAIAVRTIRALVCAPSAQRALEKGSDTVRAFALRAVSRVLRDDKVPPWVVLDRLRNILDEGNLNRALGAAPRLRSKLPPGGPETQ